MSVMSLGPKTEHFIQFLRRQLAAPYLTDGISQNFSLSPLGVAIGQRSSLRRVEVAGHVGVLQH